jgi:Arsenical pump membrane protein
MRRTSGTRPTNVEIRADDPSLTGHEGLLLTGELAARTDLVARLSRAVDAVRPFEQRRRGRDAGELLVSLAEMMVAGGDHLVHLDELRGDQAGAELRAVGKVLPPTTAGQLARRLNAHQCQAAVTEVARVGDDVDRHLGWSTAGPVTLDLDSFDSEVYGRLKQRAAFNLVELLRCGYQVRTTLRFDADWRAMLAAAIADRRLFRLTCGGLVAVALAYLAASAMGLPLGPIAVAGAALLAALGAAARNLQAGQVRVHVSLTLLVYVAALLVLVRGIEGTGLTAAAAGWLAGFVHGPPSAVAAGLLGAAAGANLINNVPATLVLLSGAGAGHPATSLRPPFLIGLLAGADLGPNLTPIGSLSTMLWLVIVRRNGVEVTSLQYLRVGLVVAPVLLLVAGLAIGLTFR